MSLPTISKPCYAPQEFLTTHEGLEMDADSPKLTFSGEDKASSLNFNTHTKDPDSPLSVSNDKGEVESQKPPF